MNSKICARGDMHTTRTPQFAAGLLLLLLLVACCAEPTSAIDQRTWLPARTHTFPAHAFTHASSTPPSPPAPANTPPTPNKRLRSTLSQSVTATAPRAPSTDLLVGGHLLPDETPQTPYAWVSAVLHQTPQGYYHQYCGGSLVHPRLVLTAAHCVCQEFGMQATHVAVGRPVLSDDSVGEVIPVLTTLISPSWNSTTATGDLAVLVLAAPSNVTPVVVLPPQFETALQAGETLQALGWGVTTTTKPTDAESRQRFRAETGSVKGYGSDQLEAVAVALITNQQCDVMYGGSAILPGHLCAVPPAQLSSTSTAQSTDSPVLLSSSSTTSPSATSPPPSPPAAATAAGTQTTTTIDANMTDIASACHGDSGGPLVTTIENVTYLVGVISFGDPNCTSKTPNVFTRVSMYEGWMLSMTRMLDMAAGFMPKTAPAHALV